jgi:hypothetical protein
VTGASTSDPHKIHQPATSPCLRRRVPRARARAPCCSPAAGPLRLPARLPPQVDEDCSGQVELSEFIKCIEKNRLSSQRKEDETDTVDAFVAMGGNVSTHARRLAAGGALPAWRAACRC